MAIDLFKTRTMLAALRQMKPAKSFLLDTFFPTIETSTTKYVDIDVMDGRRVRAPFVSPLHEGQLMERKGFTTYTYEPPYVKPKMVSSAQDFLSRDIGQNIYMAGDNAQQRAATLMGRDMAYMDEAITRREEWMASELLHTGAMTIAGKGVNREIDFGMKATHKITLAGNDLWSDETNATPMDDLRTWKRLILQDSGLSPNVVIMSPEAVDAFLDHPQVQGQLDTRRIDLGMIDPMMMDMSGAQYYGRLKDINCDLWLYDEWYYDEGTTTEKPMVRAKYVLMGSTMARTARHYGAIQDLDFGGLASVRLFPKSWRQQDPSVQYVMLQSAPLVAMHQVDAFVAAKVLA